MADNANVQKIVSFDQIHERARERSRVNKPTAALVMPICPEALTVFMRAATDGLIRPIIIAEEKSLNELLVEASLDSQEYDLVPVEDGQAAVEKGMELASDKRIQMIVQGGLASSDLFDSLFGVGEMFLKKGRVASLVAIMRPAKYDRLLMLSDGAVAVQPDLSTKIKIISNMAQVAAGIGLDNPRIAVVCAVEAVYPQMQATVDGAVLAKMSERGQIKGAVVDGPLSFDVAVDMFAATAKGVTRSDVAGQADGLLASNIEVANGIYNAMSLYGDCDIGGLVVGGIVPVAVNSAADSIEARYNSIVLATICS